MATIYRLLVLAPALVFFTSVGAFCENNLTWTQAKARRDQIKDVKYTLKFIVEKNSDKFQGVSTIDVTLNSLKRPLRIDLLTKTIESVKVNSIAVSDYKTAKGNFEIPARYLKTENQIEVSYTGEFSKEGDGFQRVVDPEDKEEYLYTDFEPFQAHQLFPCFDQPDLKANYTVSITAPAEWRVIGNELISSTTKDASGKLTTTTFKTTPKMSTYLFFLGAGGFEMWTAKAGDIPLELYARKSLAKYVDVERIFETTKKGLAFYADFFGHPFGFSKYGQVFVPEFAWGGMENPGAVALNERNIYRGIPRKTDLVHRDDLILHEMAHMWFGDLVTMAWWNDLWLNESFATYLAAISNDRAMKNDGIWLDFFQGKGWGYWQDQLSTSHPIETLVPDVRTAKGNFDGITYAKGGSSLKQLHFFVGEEGFKSGLQNYFKKYAYSNTTRQMFIDEIAKASGKDLNTWTKQWLQTAGPHRIETKWSCTKEGSPKTVSSFEIVQGTNKSKVLSPHKTKVGFFNRNADGNLSLSKTLELTFDKANTKVAEATGLTCPDFIYANMDDEDYGLYMLDPVSLSAATDVLQGKIKDPLTRLMVWKTLEQMVQDTKLKVSAYFAMAEAGLESETNEDVLAVLLGRHSSVRDIYFHYLTREQRQEFAPRFENLIWTKMLAEKDASLKKTYFDFYSSIATTSESTDRLQAILQKKTELKNIDMDQDRRWTVVSALARAGVKNAEAIIATEEKNDPSTEGKREAYAARVAIPLNEAKERLWKQMDQPDAIPYSTLRAASAQFDDHSHPELSEPFLKSYMKSVAAIDWSSHDNLVEIYFEHLFPQSICGQPLLAESKQKLKQAKNLTALAKRSWIEANDELTKCVSIRAADRVSTPIE